MRAGEISVTSVLDSISTGALATGFPGLRFGRLMPVISPRGWVLSCAAKWQDSRTVLRGALSEDV
jgi:hypothetical protein